MSQDIVVFLLLSVLAVFVLLNGILIFSFTRTRKRLDILLENGKVKDFKDILLSQKNKNDELEKQLAEAFLKIENIEKLDKKHVQKVGIVRFNPFNDLGGNQSFTIAMLDDNNTGFVFSSIFVKEGNRVYAKTIKRGKADYSLSKEEQEAINKAIKSKHDE